MSKVKSLFAAAVTLAVASSAANAAVFNLFPVVTVAFDPTFTNNVPVIQSTTGPVTTVTAPGTAEIVQVDYYFTISNLAAGEGGFGSLALDVVHSLGLDPSVGGNWNADTSTFSYKQGPLTKTQAFWASNSDAGVSTSDLVGIVAYIANPPYNLGSSSDPRATFGQGSPAHIGTVYFAWDGKSAQTLNLANVQYTTYNTNAAGGSFSNGNNVVDPNTVVFGSPVITPEPASLGVLALGGVALMARRRKA